MKKYYRVDVTLTSAMNGSAKLKAHSNFLMRGYPVPFEWGQNGSQSHSGHCGNGKITVLYENQNVHPNIRHISA
jgi:hypothetical protein